MTILDILNYSITQNASDIHLVVGRAPSFRVDGVLHDMEGAGALDDKTMQSLVFSMLTEEQQQKFLSEKDLDFAYQTDNHRFRVNLYIEREHVGMAARVIRADIPTFEELSLPKVVQDLTKLKDGIIIVTGPTGSGKSTTLASMVEAINATQSMHIMTIEDPIEFLFESKQSIVTQRQLGSDVLSFAAGLKHVLRQDPDVIMVGEMRDLETIALALTLAETGHLVFGTLHTFNAAQTVDRIIDVFPPYQQQQIRLQLAITLRAVIAQRLLPKKEGGRIANRELLLNNHAVANLIRENKVAQIRTVIQTGGELGMYTFDQDLNRLYSEGLVEKDVAEEYLSEE